MIVAARNEADRIGATLDALRRAFPGAVVIVADDASEDGTAEIALGRRRRGGQPRAPARQGRQRDRRAPRRRSATRKPTRPGTVLLCDGDLGASAAHLGRLVEAIEAGECDLAVAAFEQRVGGGFGLALRFARWAIRSRCGAEAEAPISGQRAMGRSLLRSVLPFAAGYGMEVGMTIDAVRAGARLREYELDLEHRATGRDAAGFLHRARQLRDFARAYVSRRRA